MDTIDIVLATAEMRRRARIRDEYSRRVRPVPEWIEEAELAAWPTPETIRELQAGLRLAQGLPVLGWRSLLRFAGGEYLLQQTERASTHLLEQQRSTLVEVPEFDEPVPFLHVSSRLASERKRVLREALENAATAVIQSFHNTYREFWSHLFTTAEGLGYPNLLALWEEISGISSEDFCKSLEAILRETEYTYRERMQWHLKRVLGIRLEDARRHDILALFGTDTTGAWFPRADLLPCLQRWLRDWGWELNEHPNMHVEQYPSIAGVAWCAPLEIPVDIRLAVAPAEGMWAYAQALRESAKSMLLASLPADTPQDLRCFPDPSWLEAQAEVCGGLVRTSRWIQTYRHISQPEEGLNLVQLERLFIVRRYLGKCLYERTFYEDANLDGKASR